MADTKKTKTTKEVKLNPNVWEVAYNEDLLAQALYVYRSNERKGTSNVKTRGEVRGGGRKPWKQKGTGRARHGSIRSPLWAGGGVTFGSSVSNRNWNRKINKKMAKKATCIMLSERLRNEELDFVNMPEKKVAEMRKAMLKNVDKKTLIITNNEDAEMALRNVKGIDVMKSEKINAKHLANAKNVLVDNDVVKMLEERLTNGK